MTAVFGIAVFLAFLFGAVQITLHLFASSAVSAAAFDVARAMAAEDGISCADAEQRARSTLGSYGSQATIECPTAGISAEEVAVRVVAPSPAPLLDGFFGLGLDLGQIQREAIVRQERFRAGEVAP